MSRRKIDRITIERINKIPPIAEELIIEMLPVPAEVGSERVKKAINEIDSQLSDPERFGYIARLDKKPIATVWVALIDEQVRLQVFLTKELRNAKVDSRVQLEVIKDLKKRKSFKYITGYINLEKETNPEPILKNLRAEGLAAYVRRDLDLLLDKKMPLVKDRPPLPERGYDFDRWRSKYLDDVLDVDFQAYQGTLDSEIMYEFFDQERHAYFFSELIDGEYGKLMEKESQVLLDKGVVIGVALATRIGRATALIATVSLLPEYRGKNLGKLMFRNLLHKLGRKNIRRVMLSITEGEPTTEKLIGSFNFSLMKKHISYLLV